MCYMIARVDNKLPDIYYQPMNHPVSVEDIQGAAYCIAVLLNYEIQTMYYFDNSCNYGQKNHAGF